MYHRKRFLIFFLFILVAACNGNPDVSIMNTTSPVNTHLPIGTQATVTLPPADTLPSEEPATPASTPTPDPFSARSQYTLTAVLNYDQHYLVVDEIIDYINQSEETLVDLRLMVEPLSYPGVFQLNGLTWADSQPVEGYEIDGNQINILLAQALQPEARIKLSISYELFLPSPEPSPETRPVPFGYSDLQTNLVDWYPFVAPYRTGQGWLAHRPGFFGEHLVYDVADFDVSIHLSDQRTDLKIAASAPAQQRGEWFHYRHLNARNFAWSVSHEYEIHRTTVGSTTITSYAFSHHSTASEVVLETTAQALDLYNQLFGPYNRSDLAIVEASFLDGMEYDGLYFLSNGFYNIYRGTPDEYLVAIAAHETAHQWFYALVGNDQALEPWLDEALCTYSERLYYEKYYPDALAWWWTYRVNYYQPRGWVDGSIYNPDGYRAYRDAVYLNGAVFLEDLRGQIGDEAFFGTLRNYIAENASQIATRENFLAVLSQHTSVEITPLLQRFFQNP